MGVNVFNASPNDPIMVRASRANITISGITDSIIALNVNCTFQRRVEMVPTIGNVRVVSASEPEGTLQIGTLIAKDSNAIEQILMKDTECTPYSMEITFGGDATCGMGNKKVSISGCVSSGVSVEMQGGRGYVASGVTVTFTQMELG